MKKRLPDFSKSKLWNDLRSSMKVEKDFELPALIINKISLEEIHQLRTASIDISNVKDFINPIDGTFEYKGQKVILYIKEQRYNDFMGMSKYKYHLCYCDTLDWMDNSGRFERYVVTQRTDGKFLVDVVDRLTGSYLEEDNLLEMDVCKNCLKKLSNHYPNEGLFRRFNVFDLDQFIKQYNTNHIKKPTYTSHNQPKNKYPDNWKEMSSNLRREVNYICSSCGEDMSENKNLLHVHHIDGYKWNVKPSNLEVLCFDCHSNKPGHSKLKFLR